MKYKVDGESLVIYIETVIDNERYCNVIARLPLAHIDDITSLIDEYRTSVLSHIL